MNKECLIGVIIVIFVVLLYIYSNRQIDNSPGPVIKTNDNNLNDPKIESFKNNPKPSNKKNKKKTNTKPIDLSKYMLTSEAPDMSKYILKTKVPPKTNIHKYISKAAIPECPAVKDMSKYVLKSELSSWHSLSNMLQQQL